jgi:hypothetical protein
MKSLSRTTGVLAALLAVVSVGVCDGQQSHGAALAPLSFLTGRWVSETPGVMQEEIWTPLSGDSITGSFRIVELGRPVFYEFWAVEVDDNRPVLKLKHFNADLIGWEDKGASTKMPLVSTSERYAVFAATNGSVSLHYHRAGNKLTCVVHHVKDGKGSDETFTLMRAGDD